MKTPREKIEPCICGLKRPMVEKPVYSRDVWGLACWKATCGLRVRALTRVDVVANWNRIVRAWRAAA